MRAILILFLISISTAFAQLPGDFNCNGEVNGIDLYAYRPALYQIFTPIDSNSCFWRNGDVNSDSLFCTRADCVQLYWHFRGLQFGDRPPQGGLRDSIILGDVHCSPGEVVSVPLFMATLDTLGGFEINLKYDYPYIRNPVFVQATELTFWAFNPICDTSVVLFSAINDTINAGRYWVGDLNFELDGEAPEGDDFTIGLTSGNYFPSGLIALSMPAYFIRPVLVPGRVWINSTSIDETPLPEKLSLNIYPNPFNAHTKIEFTIETETRVHIEILDILGRSIDTLVDSRFAAGHYSTTWNGSSRPSGVYFCKMTTLDNAVIQRMVLLK